MAKDYAEITGEVEALRTSKKTLTIEPNFEPAKETKFKELVEGKVKLQIIDFSKGKGDLAIWARFNLDMKDFKYLYERAKLSHMPIPMQRTKIHGRYKETEGQYKGYSKSFRLTIRRDAVGNDGKPKNYPWTIQISNGYAIAKDGHQEGTFYEQSGTYKETSQASFSLTDEDFLDRMETVYAYLNAYRNIVAQTLIPTGLKKLAEVRERNEFTGTSGATQAQDAKPANRPAQSAPQQSAQKQNTQAAAQSNTNKQELVKRTGTLLIKSEFKKPANGWNTATCLIDEKETVFWFKLPLADTVKLAQKEQIAIPCNYFCDSKGNFMFDSVIEQAKQETLPLQQEEKPKQKLPEGYKEETVSMVIEGFSAMEKGACAHCLIKGQPVMVFFKEVNETVQNWEKNRSTVNCVLLVSPKNERMFLRMAK